MHDLKNALNERIALLPTFDSSGCERSLNRAGLWVPKQTRLDVRQLSLGLPAILLVRYLLQLISHLAVQPFRYSNVAHAGVGRDSVPVLLACIESHRIAGMNLFDRATLTLNPAPTGRNQGLPVRADVCARQCVRPAQTSRCQQSYVPVPLP